MAHLRSLASTCDYGTCNKRQTVELFSRWNAPQGRYCRVHGQMLLAKQEAAENPPRQPKTPKPGESPF